MGKHKLIIELTEPLNVEEFNHLCGFLEGAEGIRNKYSTINEGIVPAETLVMPKIADIIKKKQKDIRTVYNESAKISKNATTLKLVADHQIDLLNDILEEIKSNFSA